MGIDVKDVQDGYSWNDDDGSWVYNKSTETWEGQGETDYNIKAETVELKDVEIVHERTISQKASALMKKGLKLASDFAAPFVETSQDIFFSYYKSN